MENVKSKVGELEDESLSRVCQQQSRIKDLQKEQKALQVLRISLEVGACWDGSPWCRLAPRCWLTLVPA